MSPDNDLISLLKDVECDLAICAWRRNGEDVSRDILGQLDVSYFVAPFRPTPSGLLDLPHTPTRASDLRRVGRVVNLR